MIIKDKNFLLIIEELKLIWTILKIVHGKVGHPQSQSSVAWANGDCKNKHNCNCGWKKQIYKMEH